MITVTDLFCGAGGSGLGAQVKGNKREQVRQLGNAVTPPAAEWLIRAVVDSGSTPATGSTTSPGTACGKSL